MNKQLEGSRGNELEISLVVPFFNESGLVEEFCSRTNAVLKDISASYEIVAVNDGSTDDTNSRLREISRSLPHVRVLTLSRNRGQAIALHAGIQASCGRYVVIMDGDLQHLPEEIPVLIEELKKGYDIVSGRRIRRKESLITRRIPSFLANSLIRATTGCKIRDMGGFQCLRGEMARGLHIRPGYQRFLPALIHVMGGSSSEVPVSAPPRKGGSSKYGLSRAFDVLLDILMLWFQSASRSRPVYLLGRISVALFVLASLICCWLIYERFAYGYHMGSRPPFLLAILMYVLSGVTFFGAIGLEMTSDVLNRIAGSKAYVVQSDKDETTEAMPALSSSERDVDKPHNGSPTGH